MMTRFAEVQLDAGKFRQARDAAEVAIDELDSIHARSWLVRARARDALGDLDGAAADYQAAVLAGDEPGIGRAAEQGLDEALRRGANLPDDEDE
jgi:Tfp pilus assembly protein PilF